MMFQWRFNEWWWWWWWKRAVPEVISCVTTQERTRPKRSVSSSTFNIRSTVIIVSILIIIMILIIGIQFKAKSEPKLRHRQIIQNLHASDLKKQSIWFNHIKQVHILCLVIQISLLDSKNGILQQLQIDCVSKIMILLLSLLLNLIQMRSLEDLWLLVKWQAFMGRKCAIVF